ncbi:MAG: FecCD family ABC transporter permease [Thermodesulfovibrionales bacterium]
MSKVRFFLFLSLTLIIISIAVFSGPRIINPFSLNNTEKEILLSIRLPRVLVAVLIGAALGVSGAILQGILRNPLADPYILGISSGASLTAAIGLLLGLSNIGRFSIPVTAFIGASTASLIVGVFGWKRGGLWPERLLLAGVGLSFLFHACLILLMSISTDEGLRRSLLWIFGDLAMAEWSLIPFGFLFIITGFFISILRAKALNALMLGDEFTHSLGFSVNKERVLFFLSMALMTSASVSLGGTIGFVGLLVPHIVRFFSGADNRYLIPASGLFGASFLCLADLIGRTAFSPSEIPSGVVTAIIGSPYFLYLLRRRDVILS